MVNYDDKKIIRLLALCLIHSPPTAKASLRGDFPSEQAEAPDPVVNGRTLGSIL